MPSSFLKTWFGSEPRLPRGRDRRFRPRVEGLEGRLTPATLFVNDNWFAATDLPPAGPSAGDTVDNRNDGGPEVTGTFGANAFATIQDAVTFANPGDTVQVLQGTYPETVTVSKALTLRGAQAGVDARTRDVPAGQESVVGGADGAFRLEAGDIVLDGFTVQGQTGTGVDGAGIRTSAAFAGYQVRNTILQDNTIGLDLASSGAAPTVVERNLVRDNDNANINFGSAGILAHRGLANAAVRDNRVAGVNIFGLRLDGTGGRLDGTGTAITAVTVTGNEFADGNGVDLLNVDGATVAANRFAGSYPFSGGQRNDAVLYAGGSDGLVVDGNTFGPSTHNAFFAANFGADAAADLTFTRNVITRNAAELFSAPVLIGLYDLAGTSVVSENALTLVGTTTFASAITGLALFGPNTGTVLVLGNTFNGGGVAPENGGGSTALRLDGPLPATAVVDVKNNVLTGFRVGFASAGLAAGARVTVFDNHLAGNFGAAITHEASDVDLDASGNWFGATAPAVVAAQVVGNVDYSPWLHAGTDVVAAPGFQGNFTDLHVTAAGRQVGAAGRIQEALDLPGAAAQTVVRIEPGTYFEAVSIRRSRVTLRGDPGTAAAGAGTRAPILDGTGRPGHTITLQNGVTDVTITGLKFRNGGYGVVAGATNPAAFGTTRVVIDRNTFAGLAKGAIRTDGPSPHQDWLIRRNFVTDVGGYGFDLRGYVSDVAVADNVLRATRPMSAGILVRAEAASGVADRVTEPVIVRNDFAGRANAGIYLLAIGRPTFIQAKLTNNALNVKEGHGVVLAEESQGRVSAKLFNNRLGATGGAAVKSLLAAGNVVDASGNYFGPTGVLGLVDRSPFLVSAADIDANTPGFQGSFFALQVRRGEVQAGGDPIREALYLASSGGTVSVPPGPVLAADIDTGDIENRNVKLVLLGASRPITPNTGGSIGVLRVVGNYSATVNGLFRPAVKLEVTGNFAFNPSATFVVQLNGPRADQYDKLVVFGDMNLNNAKLQVDLKPGYTPAVGQRFAIAQKGGGLTRGTFRDLPNRSVITVNGLRFVIHYNGFNSNDVFLERVR